MAATVCNFQLEIRFHHQDTESSFLDFCHSHRRLLIFFKSVASWRLGEPFFEFSVSSPNQKTGLFSVGVKLSETTVIGGFLSEKLKLNVSLFFFFF